MLGEGGPEGEENWEP